MSSEKAVKICDPAFDVFEMPVMCRDQAERYLTHYFDDTAETFMTQRPSYRISTKDLDEFLDMSNAFLQVELDVSVSNPAYGFDVVGQPIAGANVGAPMNLRQAITTATAPNAGAAGIQGVVAVDGNGDGAAVAAPDLLNGANGGWNVHNPLRLFRQTRYMINDEEVERSDIPADCTELRKYLNGSPVRANIMRHITGVNHSIDSESSENYRLCDPKFLTPDGKLRVIIPVAELFASCDEAKIVRGIRHSIQLIPDWIQGTLFSAVAGGNGWVISNHYISRLRMYVPIVKPSLEALHGYEMALNDGDKAMRVFETAQHYSSNTFQGTRFNWNITSLANKPTRVVVYVTDSNDADPQVRRAQQEFSKVLLKVNSKYLPVQPYEFEDADYIRAYYDYLECSRKMLHDEDAEPALSYTKWKDSQKIFCFNMPDDASIFEGVKTNDINVEVTFNNALTRQHTLNAVVFSETKLEFEGLDSRLRITQSNETLN